MANGTSTLGSQIIKAYTSAKENATKPGISTVSGDNSFGNILKDMVQDQVKDTVSSIKASEKTNMESLDRKKGAQEVVFSLLTAKAKLEETAAIRTEVVQALQEIYRTPV